MNPTRINLLIMVLFLFILLFDCNFAYQMISSICKKARYQHFYNNSRAIYSNDDVDLSDYSSNRITRKVAPESFDPLFLTPLIRQKRISEAVSLSRVKEPLFAYESYSGFLTIDEIHKSHIFFWFFPCTTNRTNVSLIVWLEGGSLYPSSSRVFNPLGPYILQDGKIKPSSDTLLEYFHVLYIDSPVGAGFSFAEHEAAYSKTMEDAAKDVVGVISQFNQLFPEYTRNGLFFSGEMYMSKVAVASAYRVHLEDGFQLKGLMLPNAFIDPIRMIGSSQLLYQLGVIDWYDRDELQYLENEVVRLIRSEKWNLAVETYQQTISMLRKFGFEHPYDYTNPINDNKQQRIIKVVSLPAIRRAIHVGQLEYNDMQRAFCYLTDDFLRSAEKMLKLLTIKYNIFFYVSQFGIEVNIGNVYEFLKYLEWPGAVRFKFSPYDGYCVDDELIGFKKTADYLSYMVLRNTGNMDLKVNPKWLIGLWNYLAGIEDATLQIKEC